MARVRRKKEKERERGGKEEESDRETENRGKGSGEKSAFIKRDETGKMNAQFICEKSRGKKRGQGLRNW